MPLEWTGCQRIRFDSIKILPATQGQRWKDECGHANAYVCVVKPAFTTTTLGLC